MRLILMIIFRWAFFMLTMVMMMGRRFRRVMDMVSCDAVGCAMDVRRV